MMSVVTPATTHTDTDIFRAHRGRGERGRIPLAKIAGTSPLSVFRHFPDFHPFVGTVCVFRFSHFELEGDDLHFVLLGNVQHLLADETVGILLVGRVVGAFDETAAG